MFVFVIDPDPDPDPLPLAEPVEVVRMSLKEGVRFRSDNPSEAAEYGCGCDIDEEGVEVGGGAKSSNPGEE